MYKIETGRVFMRDENDNVILSVSYQDEFGEVTTEYLDPETALPFTKNTVDEVEIAVSEDIANDESDGVAVEETEKKKTFLQFLKGLFGF